nr:DHH family phosphoesterase [Candidatus Sigynarchaeota archaeon]
MENHEKFLANVAECKVTFMKVMERKENPVFIITHHDADGIAAAGIMAIALGRLNIPFQARVIKQLSLKHLESILGTNTQQGSKFLIFTDFGSNQLDFLVKHANPSHVLIVDHHPVHGADAEATRGMLHVNPVMFGINGETDVSGAGVAYFFAKALHPANEVLAPLAIVGALGDGQDVGDNSSLVGLNRTILDDGKRLGLVAETIDIKVSGRYNRPVHLALANTTEPFFPGLSGDENACVDFLKKLKIPLVSSGDKQRTVADLAKEEKSTLVSSLIEWSLKHGVNPNSVKNVIGNIYIAEKEDPTTNLKDLREFASILNACGRLGKGGIGLGIAMGDRMEIFLEGQQYINDFKAKIANFMTWIKRTDAIKKHDNLQILEGGEYIDDAMTGTVVGMLLDAKQMSDNLPILGWACLKEDSKIVKISMKAKRDLVQKGLNLGSAMQKTVLEMELDIPCGGNASAASIEIPKINMERFIKVLGRIVGAQLKLDGLKDTGLPGQSWI